MVLKKGSVVVIRHWLAVSPPREQSVNSAKAKFLAYLAVFPDRRQK